jgi:cell division septation protein DedD
VAEPSKSGSGKKFSITIQVPEDLTAQWPNRATAEKLVQEVYTAMGSASTSQQLPPQAALPSQSAAPPTRRGMATVVLAALVAGGVGGYLGARLYFGPIAERSIAPAPARSEPVQSTPASPVQPAQADPTAISSTPTAQAPTAQPVDQPSASKSITSVHSAYNIQVGAYRVRENAEVLLQRLQQDGFQAQIVRSSGLYVVQLGPFQSLQDAGRQVESLRAHQYDAFVIRITSAGN